jgi:hypothetical protein
MKKMGYEMFVVEKYELISYAGWYFMLDASRDMFLYAYGQ